MELTLDFKDKSILITGGASGIGLLLGQCYAKAGAKVALVDINGEATTFPAGTFYAEIMQAQLEADGSSIVAFNPDVNDGVGSGDGYDGWYNVESAVAELEIAIEELKIRLDRYAQQ